MASEYSLHDTPFKLEIIFYRHQTLTLHKVENGVYVPSVVFIVLLFE